MPRIRHIAGCMTGTSLDGLDVALVEITGTGLEMSARFMGMVSRPLAGLADELRHFAGGKSAEPIRFLRAARQLGALHADALDELCQHHLPGYDTPVGQPPGARVDLVVAHGQTIWHAPGEGLSWQLFDPWLIVHRHRVPVCYDLRQADLIAGGQGAPITPLADWVMFRRPNATQVIVNLGGICNVTVIPAGQDVSAVSGADVGPCNLLIDGVVRALRPELRFDLDGKLAAKGALSDTVFDELYGHSPFQGEVGAQPPQSLGREQYSDDRIRAIAVKVRDIFPLRAPMTPDQRDGGVVASAVEAVAARLAEWLRSVRRPYEVVLAGGGVRNKTLVERIEAHVSATVATSDELGIPCEAREAMGFAVLGALAEDGVPITLPRVTGAKDVGRRAGAWVYP